MIDRYAYLKEKAAAIGLQLLKSPDAPPSVSEVYILGDGQQGGQHWVGLSMSGLELLQNAAAEASIKDLMDERFNASLQTLKKYSAA